VECHKTRFEKDESLIKNLGVEEKEAEKGKKERKKNLGS
jgi:hypothetical protein